MATHRLVKRAAPPFWTRWDVFVGAQHIGTLERRGGFAPWTALATDGALIATMCPTRAAALDSILALDDALG